MLSTSAFKFDLRRYNKALLPAVLEVWESPSLADCPGQVAVVLMVWRCRLTI
jgi:hypothetical protein